MTHPDELVRFTMSLAREDYDTLTELAGLLKVSRASLVRDMIESSRPVLAVMLDAVRTMTQAPSRQRETMAGLAEQMGAQMVSASTAYDEARTLLGPPASNTGVTTL